MTTALPTATPSTATVARTRLAGDAATVVGWLRVLMRDDGPAEISAALDALGALRTGLRSLRPILDKAWTVALRDGLDLVTGTLGAVHALDGQMRLLVECGPSGPAADLLAKTAAERAALVSTVRRRWTRRPTPRWPSSPPAASPRRCARRPPSAIRGCPPRCCCWCATGRSSRAGRPRRARRRAGSPRTPPRC